MQKLKTCMLSLLLFFIAAVVAEAEEKMTALRFGSWSEWQTEPARQDAFQEVEKKLQSIDESYDTYRYTRYKYFNTEKEAWYAVPEAPEDGQIDFKTGEYQHKETDQPLKIEKIENGKPIYEGGWYNEERIHHAAYRQTEMYRTRKIERIECDVTARQMLMFPDETRQLTVKFDDDSAMTFESDNIAAASVDRQGMITANETGRTVVTVRSVSGCQAQVEVLVCKKEAQIPDGIYTLRLKGSEHTLTAGKNITRKCKNLSVGQYTGERIQRFIVDGNGKRGGNYAFTLHPINHEKWRMTIMNKKKKNAIGLNVTVKKGGKKKRQEWTAVYVPDGSYIICPKGHADYALVTAEKGGNVGVMKTKDMDSASRWIPIRAGRSIDPETPFDQPVNADASVFLKRGYDEAAYPGISLSGSNRFYVLSAAKGTVLETGTDCIHDEPKTANEDGKIIDPCDLEQESLGNYILVDHGGGVTALYAHLSEANVSPGDTLYQGSVIGRSGATGSADGEGLYFEMRKDGKVIDPGQYIRLPKIGEPFVKEKK